jgi:hypothetical protein
MCRRHVQAVFAAQRRQVWRQELLALQPKEQRRPNRVIICFEDMLIQRQNNNQEEAKIDLSSKHFAKASQHAKPPPHFKADFSGCIEFSWSISALWNVEVLIFLVVLCS